MRFSARRFFDNFTSRNFEEQYMAKNNYYVVWKGRKTGVFGSWESCKEQVHGFEGAQYKGYPTEAAANAAFKTNYWKAVNPAQKQTVVAGANGAKPVVPSLAVDAACSGNPGKLEYRGVETATGREIFRQGPFEMGTNNIGEFLAIVHGLALLKAQHSNVPIYSDSVNALAWVKAKQCRTKLERCAKNEELFRLIERAENWLKDNSYTTKLLKWPTSEWGEIPADFGRK
jgi:ribonuclease HI